MRIHRVLDEIPVCPGLRNLPPILPAGQFCTCNLPSGQSGPVGGVVAVVFVKVVGLVGGSGRNAKPLVVVVVDCAVFAVAVGL